MEQLNSIIAENLKRIREQKKLSLDNVAKLTGVSKSMLGQIERCEVNPTVSTVWKIANGLKCPFTTLIHSAEADIELVEQNTISPLLEDDGRVEIYPIFPLDHTRRFEVYTVVLQPDGYLSTEPHLKQTQEFITVGTGVLTIGIAGKKLAVKAGDSIRFKADEPHSYQNNEVIACTLTMVIYYPG